MYKSGNNKVLQNRLESFKLYFTSLFLFIELGNLMCKYNLKLNTIQMMFNLNGTETVEDLV